MNKPIRSQGGAGSNPQIFASVAQTLAATIAIPIWDVGDIAAPSDSWSTSAEASKQDTAGRDACRLIISKDGVQVRDECRVSQV